MAMFKWQLSFVLASFPSLADYSSVHLTSLINNPTRALVSAAKYLYFLYSLGNLSAAFFLARDGGSCAAQPGLVVEKRELPKTPKNTQNNI